MHKNFRKECISKIKPMNKRIGYISDDKKGVFKIDISNLSGKRLLNHVLFITMAIEKISEPTDFYVDMRGCKLNVESLAYLKIVGKKAQPYINKSAIIGIDNNIKPFFDIYLKYTNSNIKSCQNDIQVKAHLGIEY